MNIKNFQEFLKDVPTRELKAELERRKNNQTKPSMDLSNPIHKNAFNIMNQLDDAFSKFGKYSFYDKGPDEVLDLNSIYKTLSKMSIDKVSEILIYVMDNYEKFSSKEGTEKDAITLVNSIIHDFDGHDDFELFFEMDDRFEY
jgi:hypothetical protein